MAIRCDTASGSASASAAYFLTWTFPRSRAHALGLAVAAALWLAPEIARACSCVYRDRSPDAIRQAAANADAVFAGRVLRRTRVPVSSPGVVREDLGDREKRIVFAVSRTWRGALERRVTVHTALEPAACGLHFAIGSRHVVFAHRRKDGRLDASACGYTEHLADAAAILEALGEGSQPPRLDTRGCAIGSESRPFALLLFFAWPGRRRVRK